MFGLQEAVLKASLPNISGFFQVLSVSPEHPAVLLLLRQVQCQQLLGAADHAVLPDGVLEQLNNTVMMNPTNLAAWHVGGNYCSTCFTLSSTCWNFHQDSHSKRGQLHRDALKY